MIHCIRTSFLHNDTVYDAEMRRDAFGCLWYGDIISETGEILYNDVSLDTNTECAFTHLETLWLEHWKEDRDKRFAPIPNEMIERLPSWALNPGEAKAHPTNRKKEN